MASSAFPKLPAFSQIIAIGSKIDGAHLIQRNKNANEKLIQLTTSANKH